MNACNSKSLYFCEEIKYINIIKPADFGGIRKKL